MSLITLIYKAFLPVVYKHPFWKQGQNILDLCVSVLRVDSAYSECRVFRETHLNPLVGSDADSGSRAGGGLPCAFPSLG